MHATDLSLQRGERSALGHPAPQRHVIEARHGAHGVEADEPVDEAAEEGRLEDRVVNAGS